MSRPILSLFHGIDVEPMVQALEGHPELWNQHRGRTDPADSPHHGLDDIWARYAPPGADDSGPHASVWYPSPILSVFKDFTYPLMGMVRGDELGGVLITRIPPGATCKPHTDPGWHARYYEKFALQIKAAPGQKFCFENAELETAPGDVFWFDNSRLHWVENPTEHERITMIVCIRPDGKN